MKTVGDIDGAVAEGSYDRFYGPQMVKCWIFQLNDAIIRVNVNGYLIGRKVLERKFDHITRSISLENDGYELPLSDPEGSGFAPVKVKYRRS